MGWVSTREGRTGWLGRRGPNNLRKGAHCVYGTRAKKGGRPARAAAAAEERELRFNPQVEAAKKELRS